MKKVVLLGILCLASAMAVTTNRITSRYSSAQTSSSGPPSPSPNPNQQPHQYSPSRLDGADLCWFCVSPVNFTGDDFLNVVANDFAAVMPSVLGIFGKSVSYSPEIIANHTDFLLNDLSYLRHYNLRHKTIPTRDVLLQSFSRKVDYFYRDQVGAYSLVVDIFHSMLSRNYTSCQAQGFPTCGGHGPNFFDPTSCLLDRVQRTNHDLLGKQFTTTNRAALWNGTLTKSEYVKLIVDGMQSVLVNVPLFNHSQIVPMLMGFLAKDGFNSTSIINHDSFPERSWVEHQFRQHPNATAIGNAWQHGLEVQDQKFCPPGTPFVPVDPDHVWGQVAPQKLHSCIASIPQNVFSTIFESSLFQILQGTSIPMGSAIRAVDSFLSANYSSLAMINQAPLPTLGDLTATLSRSNLTKEQAEFVSRSTLALLASSCFLTQRTFQIPLPISSLPIINGQRSSEYLSNLTSAMPSKIASVQSVFNVFFGAEVALGANRADFGLASRIWIGSLWYLKTDVLSAHSSLPIGLNCIGTLVANSNSTLHHHTISAFCNKFLPMAIGFMGSSADDLDFDPKSQFCPSSSTTGQQLNSAIFSKALEAQGRIVAGTLKIPSEFGRSLQQNSSSSSLTTFLKTTKNPADLAGLYVNSLHPVLDYLVQDKLEGLSIPNYRNIKNLLLNLGLADSEAIAVTYSLFFVMKPMELGCAQFPSTYFIQPSCFPIYDKPAFVEIAISSIQGAFTGPQIAAIRQMLTRTIMDKGFSYDNLPLRSTIVVELVKSTEFTVDSATRASSMIWEYWRYLASFPCGSTVGPSMAPPTMGPPSYQPPQPNPDPNNPPNDQNQLYPSRRDGVDLCLFCLPRNLTGDRFLDILRHDVDDMMPSSVQLFGQSLSAMTDVLANQTAQFFADLAYLHGANLTHRTIPTHSGMQRILSMKYGPDQSFDNRRRAYAFVNDVVFRVCLPRNFTMCQAKGFPTCGGHGGNFFDPTSCLISDADRRRQTDPNASLTMSRRQYINELIDGMQKSPISNGNFNQALIGLKSILAGEGFNTSSPMNWESLPEADWIEAELRFRKQANATLLAQAWQEQLAKLEGKYCSPSPSFAPVNSSNLLGVKQEDTLGQIHQCLAYRSLGDWRWRLTSALDYLLGDAGIPTSIAIAKLDAFLVSNLSSLASPSSSSSLPSRTDLSRLFTSSDLPLSQAEIVANYTITLLYSSCAFLDNSTTVDLPISSLNPFPGQTSASFLFNLRTSFSSKLSAAQKVFPVVFAQQIALGLEVNDFQSSTMRYLNALSYLNSSVLAEHETLPSPLTCLKILSSNPAGKYSPQTIVTVCTILIPALLQAPHDQANDLSISSQLCVPKDTSGDAFFSQITGLALEVIVGVQSGKVMIPYGFGSQGQQQQQQNGPSPNTMPFNSPPPQSIQFSSFSPNSPMSPSPSSPTNQPLSPGPSKSSFPGSSMNSSPGPSMSSPGPSKNSSPGPSMSSPGPSMSSPGPSMSSPGPSMSSPGPSMSSPGLSMSSPALSKSSSPGSSSFIPKFIALEINSSPSPSSIPPKCDLNVISSLRLQTAMNCLLSFIPQTDLSHLALPSLSRSLSTLRSYGLQDQESLTVVYALFKATAAIGSGCPNFRFDFFYEPLCFNADSSALFNRTWSSFPNSFTQPQKQGAWDRLLSMALLSPYRTIDQFPSTDQLAQLLLQDPTLSYDVAKKASALIWNGWRQFGIRSCGYQQSQIPTPGPSFNSNNGGYQYIASRSDGIDLCLLCASKTMTGAAFLQTLKNDVADLMPSVQQLLERQIAPFLAFFPNQTAQFFADLSYLHDVTLSHKTLPTLPALQQIAVSRYMDNPWADSAMGSLMAYSTISHIVFEGILTRNFTTCQSKGFPTCGGHGGNFFDPTTCLMSDVDRRRKQGDPNAVLTMTRSQYIQKLIDGMQTSPSTAQINFPNAVANLRTVLTSEGFNTSAVINWDSLPESDWIQAELQFRGYPDAIAIAQAWREQSAVLEYKFCPTSLGFTPVDSSKLFRSTETPALQKLHSCIASTPSDRWRASMIGKMAFLLDGSGIPKGAAIARLNSFISANYSTLATVSLAPFPSFTVLAKTFMSPDLPLPQASIVANITLALLLSSCQLANASASVALPISSLPYAPGQTSSEYLSILRASFPSKLAAAKRLYPVFAVDEIDLGLKIDDFLSASTRWLNALKYLNSSAPAEHETIPSMLSCFRTLLSDPDNHYGPQTVSSFCTDLIPTIIGFQNNDTASDVPIVSQLCVPDTTTGPQFYDQIVAMTTNAINDIQSGRVSIPYSFDNQNYQPPQNGQPMGTGSSPNIPPPSFQQFSSMGPGPSSFSPSFQPFPSMGPGPSSFSPSFQPFSLMGPGPSSFSPSFQPFSSMGPGPSSFSPSFQPFSSMGPGPSSFSPSFQPFSSKGPGPSSPFLSQMFSSPMPSGSSQFGSATKFPNLSSFVSQSFQPQSMSNGPNPSSFNQPQISFFPSNPPNPSSFGSMQLSPFPQGSSNNIPSQCDLGSDPSFRLQNALKCLIDYVKQGDLPHLSFPSFSRMRPTLRSYGLQDQESTTLIYALYRSLSFIGAGCPQFHNTFFNEQFCFKADSSLFLNRTLSALPPNYPEINKRNAMSKMSLMVSTSVDQFPDTMALTLMLMSDPWFTFESARDTSAAIWDSWRRMGIGSCSGPQTAMPTPSMCFSASSSSVFVNNVANGLSIASSSLGVQVDIGQATSVLRTWANSRFWASMFPFRLTKEMLPSKDDLATQLLMLVNNQQKMANDIASVIVFAWSSNQPMQDCATINGNNNSPSNSPKSGDPIFCEAMSSTVYNRTLFRLPNVLNSTVLTKLTMIQSDAIRLITTGISSLNVDQFISAQSLPTQTSFASRSGATSFQISILFPLVNQVWASMKSDCSRARQSMKLSDYPIPLGSNLPVSGLCFLNTNGVAFSSSTQTAVLNSLNANRDPLVTYLSSLGITVSPTDITTGYATMLQRLGNVLAASKLNLDQDIASIPNQNQLYTLLWNEFATDSNDLSVFIQADLLSNTVWRFWQTQIDLCRGLKSPSPIGTGSSPTPLGRFCEIVSVSVVRRTLSRLSAIPLDQLSSHSLTMNQARTFIAMGLSSLNNSQLFFPQSLPTREMFALSSTATLDQSLFLWNIVNQIWTSMTSDCSKFSSSGSAYPVPKGSDIPIQGICLSDTNGMSFSLSLKSSVLDRLNRDLSSILVWSSTQGQPLTTTDLQNSFTSMIAHLDHVLTNYGLNLNQDISSQILPNEDQLYSLVLADSDGPSPNIQQAEFLANRVWLVLSAGIDNCLALRAKANAIVVLPAPTITSLKVDTMGVTSMGFSLRYSSSGQVGNIPQPFIRYWPLDSNGARTSLGSNFESDSWISPMGGCTSTGCTGTQYGLKSSTRYNFCLKLKTQNALDSNATCAQSSTRADPFTCKDTIFSASGQCGLLFGSTSATNFDPSSQYTSLGNVLCYRSSIPCIQAMLNVSRCMDPNSDPTAKFIQTDCTAALAWAKTQPAGACDVTMALNDTIVARGCRNPDQATSSICQQANAMKATTQLACSASSCITGRSFVDLCPQTSPIASCSPSCQDAMRSHLSTCVQPKLALASGGDLLTLQSLQQQLSRTVSSCDQSCQPGRIATVLAKCQIMGSSFPTSPCSESCAFELDQYLTKCGRDFYSTTGLSPVLSFQSKCLSDNARVAVPPPIVSTPTGTSLTWSNNSTLTPVWYSIFKVAQDGAISQLSWGPISDTRFDLNSVVPPGQTVQLYVVTSFQSQSGSVSQSPPSLSVRYSSPRLSVLQPFPITILSKSATVVNVLLPGLPIDAQNIVVRVTDSVAQTYRDIVSQGSGAQKAVIQSLNPKTTYSIMWRYDTPTMDMSPFSIAVDVRTLSNAPDRPASFSITTCGSSSCSLVVQTPAITVGGAALKSCQITYGTNMAFGFPCSSPNALYSITLNQLNEKTTYHMTASVRDVNDLASVETSEVIGTTSARQALVKSFTASDPTNADNVYGRGDTMTIGFDGDAQSQTPFIYAYNPASGLIGALFANLNLTAQWESSSSLIYTVKGSSNGGSPKPTQACASAITQIVGSKISSSCVVLTGNFGEFVPTAAPQPSGGGGGGQQTDQTKVFLFSGGVLSLLQGTIAPLKFMAFSSSSQVTGSLPNTVLNFTATASNGFLIYQGVTSSTIRASVSAVKLIAQLKEMRYTGKTHFRGNDIISISVSNTNGIVLATLDVSVFVIFVKESPGVNLTSSVTYKANRWVQVAPIPIWAFDAENNTVEVQIIAGEAGQTLPNGARQSKVKLSSTQLSQVSYNPSFGTEARQITMKGPLNLVQTALAGVSFQTTEYGQITQNSLIVQIQDVFATPPTYKDVSRSQMLIQLDPACNEAVPPQLSSAMFLFNGQKVTIELSFNGSLGISSRTSIDCASLLSLNSVALIGSGAFCQTSSSSSVNIALGQRWSANVNDTISIRQNSFVVCPGSSVFAAGSAVLGAPVEIRRPSVKSIIGPTRLSLGQNLQLTAYGSNDFGRELRCFWSASNFLEISTLPSDPCTITALAAVMNPGDSYTIGCIIKNVFGQISEQQVVVVTTSDQAIPIVYAVGSSAVSVVKSSAPFVLKMATDVPFKEAIFTWFGQSLPQSASDRRNFITVQPSTLVANSVYKWTCFVAHGRVNNSITFTVTVGASPLVASIAGGLQRQLFANDAIVLDGSKSTDPDAGSNTGLTFEWDCYDELGNSATNPSGVALSLSPVPVLTLPGQTLNPGIYTMYLTVSDDASGRSQSTQTIIEIVSSPIPKITIASAPGRINPTSSVTASAATVIVKSDQSEIPSWKSSCSYSWTLKSSGTGGKDVPVGVGQTLCVGGRSCNNPMTFVSGDLLRFTVTVSCLELTAPATSYFETVVNSPPSTGSLNVSQSVVDAGTPIALTAFNWVDDISVQLLYSFGYYKAKPLGAPDRVTVSSQAPMPTSSIICPTGRCVVFAQIYDEEGAFTEVTRTVTVSPKVFALQEVIDRIANASCETVMNLVTTINSTNPLVAIQLNKAFSACQTLVSPNVMLDSTLSMPISPTITIADARAILVNAVKIASELPADERYKLFQMFDLYVTTSPNLAVRRRLLAINANPDQTVFERFANGLSVITTQSASLLVNQEDDFTGYANSSTTTRRFVAHTNPIAFKADVARMFTSSPNYRLSITVPSGFYAIDRTLDTFVWGIVEKSNAFTESQLNNPNILGAVSPVVQFGVMSETFMALSGVPASPVVVDLPLVDGTCTALPCSVKCLQFDNKTKVWNTTSVLTTTQTELTQVSCSVSASSAFVAVYRMKSAQSTATVKQSVLQNPTTASIAPTTHALRESVSLTLRLMLNFTQVAQNIASFKTAFAASLATALNISPSRIFVVSATPGSVIVTFVLVPDSSATTVAILANQIIAQIADPSSKLRLDSSLSVDSSYPPSQQAMIDCGDGSWSSSCNGLTPHPTTAPASSDPTTDSGGNAGGAIGGVIAAIAALGILIILYRRCKRRQARREAATSVPHQDAPNPNAQPVIYVKNQMQPGMAMPVGQAYAIQGQAVYQMQGAPAYPMQGQPAYPMQGQPAYPMQGQPAYPMQGQPIYQMQPQAAYPMQGAPVFSQPGYAVQSQPNFVVQSHPPN